MRSVEVLAGAARRRPHRHPLRCTISTSSPMARRRRWRRSASRSSCGRAIPRCWRLRDQGVIKAFGAGINEWRPAQSLAERGDFDLFLLAGRYTLLEQEALEVSCRFARSAASASCSAAPTIPASWRPAPSPAPTTIIRRRRRTSSTASAASRRSASGMASGWSRRRCSFRCCTPASSRSFPAASGWRSGEQPRPPRRRHSGGALEELKSEGLMREDAPTG